MHYRQTIVWQKAMQVVEELYRLVPRLPKEETYGIHLQITRAAVSIATNIAEGWTSGFGREKAQFLAIAQGSLAETETLLPICERQRWLPLPETKSPWGVLDEGEPNPDNNATRSPDEIISLLVSFPLSLLAPLPSLRTAPHPCPRTIQSITRVGRNRLRYQATFAGMVTR
jgi:four helix bundle protein